MKRYVSFDVETTKTPNESPFSTKSKLICVGIKDDEGETCYPIEYGEEPFGKNLKEIQRRIEQADLLIGFNIKFDLNWIKRYAPSIKFPDVYDVQLAAFLLGNQESPYPSLDEVLASFDLPAKSDVVATQYWNCGIDTQDVPWDVLEEYCSRDVDLTLRAFHKQKTLFTGNKLRLLKLQLEDLLTLQDAEFNGLRYRFDEAEKRGKELQEEIAKIDEELHSLARTPIPLNFGSDDQLSALLYGGVVYEKYRESYVRVLKDGTEKTKERWAIRPHTLPRLVAPLEGTEGVATRGLSDEILSDKNRDRDFEGKKPLLRVYSTGEPVLKRLRARGRGKQIIEAVLKRSELAKLDDTYYTGLCTKRIEGGWIGEEIHGNFNQCVVATGRLSSSNPNLQNFAGKIKELFYSRYE